MAGMVVSHRQVVAYRLMVNHVTERLPAGREVEAAYAGLQDSAPRDALVGLAARLEHCHPDSWQAPGLVQTYSPRAAVYVLPEEGFGSFTLGRLPLDPDAVAELERLADVVCTDLDGRERRRGAGWPGLRAACATGRIALRWTTSALYVREVPRPEIDVAAARADLLRRHLHAFGPTTPSAYAWWTGLSPPDARVVWRGLEGELVAVEVEGQRAWILAADQPALREPLAAQGIRLLAAPDLRLFGQDRTGLFAGPGLGRRALAYDSFHPHVVVVDGRVVGAWGRSGGRVDVRLEPGVRAELPAATLEAVEAEARSLPIAGGIRAVSISSGRPSGLE